MIKKWYKSEKNAETDAARYNCDIVCGSNGYTDIYYLIPKSAKPGIYRKIARAQTDVKGKEYIYRVIYKTSDGDIIIVDETSAYRISAVWRGLIPEEKIYDYLAGYYTRREETSAKIRQLKENARVSHLLCDASGKKGHDDRQAIRRLLSQGVRL